MKKKKKNMAHYFYVPIHHELRLPQCMLMS